ncbi:MAG: hypothetical protein ACRDWT_02295 [Jatrophihabitantaceae bacterium]
MSIRLRTVIALAAVAAVAVLSDSGTAVAAPAPSTTTDPAAAAAGWLAQQFVGPSGKPAANGDHLDYPPTPGYGPAYWSGLTASAVFALAAAKVGAGKIDTALGYMARNVATDANLGTSRTPGPYDGSVATAALAAIVGGADPSAFGGHNLLQALKDDECAAASKPANEKDFTTPTCPAPGAARNIYSSVSESLAILAEARGAAQHGAKYAPSPAAVKYFLLLQCSDGGFTGQTAKCTKDSAASVDETAYASAALAALGGHASELARANAWLLGQRKPGSYWIVQGGPDVNSTALAVSALAGAGHDVSRSRAWLASQQVTTGPTVGTGATRGALKYQGAFDPSSSIKATADGVLGLAPHASLATLTAAGAARTLPVFALGAGRARTSSVSQGGTQSVSASGFAAGETVRGVLHSAPVSIGSARASRTGAVSLSFTVPRSLATGSHSVVLTGASSGLSTTSETFTVTAAPVATTMPATTPTTQHGSAEGSSCDPAQLACTGRDGRQTRAEVVLGFGLLVAGAGAVYAGRRRRS